MKLLSRELTCQETQNACKALRDLGASLGTVRSQTTFKRIALLGGIEKTLKAMKEVIWHVIDTLESTFIDGGL